MAVALHQQTGFSIHAILWYIPGDETGKWAELAHAFVVLPSGRALDANGDGDIAEMGELGPVWENGIGEDKHPETQHYSSGFYSDRYGKVDITGVVTENGDVFFIDTRNHLQPKFCPYTGKPLTLTTKNKLP